MFAFIPLLLGMAAMALSKAKTPKAPTTVSIPSPASSQVLQSEDALRKRIAKTGRNSTIFTGGLLDNPSVRKEKLIPV